MTPRRAKRTKRHSYYNRPPWTAEEIAYIRELRTAAISMQAIADEFGVTRQRIEQLCTKFDIEGDRAIKQGSVDPLKAMCVVRKAKSIRDAALQLGVSDHVVRDCARELGMLPALQRMWRMRRKHELLQGIRDEVVRLGRIPRNVDTMDPDSKMAAFTTYYKHFGSMGRAIALAGFTPRKRGEWIKERVQETPRTHCKKGHALAGDNLKIIPLKNGRTERRCVICARARRDRYETKRRARQGK